MADVEHLKFMVVEDDRNFRRLLAHYVEAAGHAVTEFEDVGVALERLPNVCPDIIITNLIKRIGMNGVEFARRVRENGWAGPMMVCTTSIGEFTQAEIQGIETEVAVELSDKPVEVPALQQLVSHGVDLVRARRENQILQSP